MAPNYWPEPSPLFCLEDPCAPGPFFPPAAKSETTWLFPWQDATTCRWNYTCQRVGAEEYLGTKEAGQPDELLCG